MIGGEAARLLLGAGLEDPLILLIFQATLLLLVAALVARLLRGAPAAARHLVWSSAAGGVLVLVAGLALPAAWTVEVPFARVADPPAVSLPALPVPGEAASGSVHGEARAVLPQVRPERKDAAQLVWQWLSLLWIAGAVFLLGRRAWAAAWLARVVRAASPVRDPEVLALLERVSHRVGISRRVRLLWVDDGLSPATCGVFRPTILLPGAARSWSRGRMELVLVHELVHVARRDVLTTLICEVARSAMWIHPGMWLAERRLRDERERACDEAVLRHGAGAGRYARELLAIARECGGRRVAPVLAMAHRRMPPLERRVRRLLAAGVRTHPPLRPAGGISLALLGLVPALLVACAEVTAPPADAPDAPDDPRDPVSAELAAGVDPLSGARAWSAEDGDAVEAVGREAAADADVADAVEAQRVGDLLSGLVTGRSPRQAVSSGEPRLGCWARDESLRSGDHAVVVLFGGNAGSGTVRVRLVPERIEGRGAGRASVRPDAGLRCWNAGVAGVRLAGQWSREDVVTIHYSEDSEVYYATSERGLEARIHPPAGPEPYECELAPGAGGGAPSCRPATAGAPGLSKEPAR